MAQVPENPPAGAVVVAVQAEENNVEDNAAAANAAPPVAQEVSLFLFLCPLVITVSSLACVIRVCIFISPSLRSRLSLCFIFFLRFPT